MLLAPAVPTQHPACTEPQSHGSCLTNTTQTHLIPLCVFLCCFKLQKFLKGKFIGFRCYFGGVL